MLKDELAALHRLQRISQASNDTLRAGLELALKSAADRQRQLTAIQSSLSWDLSRPFRYLEKRWPKGALRARKMIRSAARGKFRLYRNALKAPALFHEAWYLQQYPDVAASGVEPFSHYIQHGSAEGRWPHPLFDPSWYRQQYRVTTDPLAHYLESGSKEGKKPNPLFDPAWYRLKNSDITDAIEPLSHFYDFGSAEGRQPIPLFDPKWYRLRSPDVVESGIEALTHFLHFGWKELRNPHELFDCGWYLARNPDVAAAGLNPLIHFLNFGLTENRWPHPLIEGQTPSALFDAGWYRRQYPDVDLLKMEPLVHFSRWGSEDGCRPSPLFDPAWYRRQSPDVVNSGSEALAHYLHFGWNEFRSPNPMFDPVWYLAEYTDVEKAGVEPLRHYLKHGWAENRKPNALFDPDWYRRQYPQADESGLEPLSHYAVYGEEAGYSPIPNFSPRWYQMSNADVQTSAINPFGHYLLFGKAERRAPMADWKTHRDRRRREVLGIGVPVRSVSVAVGIVTFNNIAAQVKRCIQSAQAASSVLVIDNGTASDIAATKLPSRGNIGFGAAHNILMKAAFEDGADYYIAANPDGAFEPLAIQALLQMQQAVGGGALIEALQFPEEHPKIYADDDFETPWASGCCLMIPRILFETIGGFDESFFLYCEDVDLSWRARAAGFKVKTCPRALFYHPVSGRLPDRTIMEHNLRSGVVLARKWGSAAFETELMNELERQGLNSQNIPAPERFSGARGAADFTRKFFFAPVRW